MGKTEDEEEELDRETVGRLVPPKYYNSCRVCNKEYLGHLAFPAWKISLDGRVGEVRTTTDRGKVHRYTG